MILSKIALSIGSVMVPQAGICLAMIVDESAEDHFSRYIVGAVVVGAITVPMLKWILGKLDKHLEKQDQRMQQQAKLLAVLVAGSATNKKNRDDDIRERRAAYEEFREMFKNFQEVLDEIYKEVKT